MRCIKIIGDMTSFTDAEIVCFPADEIGHSIRKIDTAETGTALYLCTIKIIK